MSVWEYVLSLGITVPAVVGIAYALFKHLGGKWLDSRFAERLEKFKHAQVQEIEHLRFRINALMDRTAKLHQHEFQVLPEVWEKLGIALAAARYFISPGREYADLERLDDDALDEYLRETKLRAFEKRELKETKGRNRRYQEIMLWIEHHDTRKRYAEFLNYYVSKGIFLEPKLKEKFDLLGEIIEEAIAEREFEARFPPKEPSEVETKKRDRFRSEAKKLYDEIEAEVQSRLWNASKLGTGG